jgi:hypothetical protein
VGGGTECVQVTGVWHLLGDSVTAAASIAANVCIVLRFVVVLVTGQGHQVPPTQISQGRIEAGEREVRRPWSQPSF